MDFLLSEDQVALKRTIGELARRELEPNAFPPPEKPVPFKERMLVLAEQQLLGINLPQEYGGGGLSVLDSVLVIEEVARHCPRGAGIVLNTSVGQADFIAHLGDHAMKSRVIPKICQGESFPAIAITEPEAGSAATAMKTTAVRDGDHFVVNGTKHFVSGAAESDLFIVYGRMNLDKPGAAGIGGVLVEKGMPGFRLGRPTVNMAGDKQWELIFEDCRVPVENILIPEGGFGKLTGLYNVERIGGTARNLGIAQLAFDRAVQYTKDRYQFNRPLSDFQGIQWMLADMALKLDSARLLLYRAADAADRGAPNPLYTSMAKIAVAEGGKEVCDKAIQIHGAYGYSQDLPLEWMYRFVRGASIAGGTMEIHRNTMAGQILGIRNNQWKR
ncbi:MAG: acyl-CoA dehydrogenase family protein [Chloroflexota bacterium]